MLPYLPIEIINIILTFRPTHPVALLIKNHVDLCLKDYLYNDYEERYDIYELDELDNIITKINKGYLKPISNYRRALLYDKDFFEREIKIYSNKDNYTDNAYIIGKYIDFSLDPIDYDYIEDCKKKLKITNKLITEFTLYKDIELLYNFNDNFYENLGITISDWIIKYHNILDR